MAEGATLAHVARPLALIRVTDRTRFTPLLACAEWHADLARAEGVAPLPLDCRSPEDFSRALDTGRPVYDAATLRRYAAADHALLEQTRPALVVGDFRISLSASARRAGVPYAAIANAHWSPLAPRRPWPRPVLPAWDWLPSALADVVARASRPLIERIHAAPLNRLRRENGLPRLGADLRRVYTDADHVLYADPPELYPEIVPSAEHHFMGALLWSPAVTVGKETAADGGDRVYATLGSSGNGARLGAVLEALARLPVTVVASTAGAPVPALPGNVVASSYRDGLEECRRARAVVCNGGAATTHQALAAGVPVVGVCRNLDQMLSMRAVERAGAGVVLREDRWTAVGLREAVRRALVDPSMRSAAERLARGIQSNDLRARWNALLSALTGDAP